MAPQRLKILDNKYSVLFYLFFHGIAQLGKAKEPKDILGRFSLLVTHQSLIQELMVQHLDSFI